MFGDDFYPTPPALAGRMLDSIEWDKVSTVLEPSAGRGDLIEQINDHRKYGRTLTIDAIEVDDDLAHILEGKGFRPVGRDFLDFESYRHYDAIIMNPPFSQGDRHLLRALDLVNDGGQVACLLNAETIKNPYTNVRRLLVQKLDDLNATIEYVSDGFTDAVRKTPVEIALITVKIDRTPTSSILESLAASDRLEEGESGPIDDVIEGDYAAGAVRRFNLEVKSGLKLIDEYLALKPLLTTGFDSKYPILELSVGRDTYGDLRNGFVDKVRMKFWQQLFQSAQFRQMFTRRTSDQYQKQISDLGRYEFTLANIKQLQVELSQSMLRTLDQAIVDLFDSFTSQYYDENSTNIHYYNGWTTNKAYIVNKRVIEGARAWSYGDYRPDWYEINDGPLGDIQKVFHYLDGKVYDIAPVQAALKQARETGQTQNIELPYCLVTFYKKGTMHITFTDGRLLKKFNLIGSQRKGWLPPNYGKKSYDDMTHEERRVVDELEGRESYEDTVRDYGFYLEERTTLPTLIGAGE